MRFKYDFHTPFSCRSRCVGKTVGWLIKIWSWSDDWHGNRVVGWRLFGYQGFIYLLMSRGENILFETSEGDGVCRFYSQCCTKTFRLTGMTMNYFARPEDEVKNFPIKFCPFCGKRITGWSR